MALPAAWFELVRLPNAIMGALAVAVGVLATVGWPPPWVPLALAMATGLLGVAGSNALNDSRDALIDRAAHPHRPVARGALTPRSAGLAGLGLLHAAVAIALFVSPVAALAAGVMLVGALAYEWWLKDRGLWGHVAVSLNTGLLFLLGGLAGVGDGLNAFEDARLVPALVMSALAALLNLARELYKGAEDAAHEASLRGTFAVRHGVVPARWAGRGVALSVVPVSLAAYPLEGFGLLYLATLAPLWILLVAVAFLSAPPVARAWLKVAMWLGFVPFLATALI